MEFEFHISPAFSSSRPQTGLGTVATRSSSRRATRGSLLSRWVPPTASPIRNRPATPAADLIAKQTQPADVAAADGTRANHASTRLVERPAKARLRSLSIAVQLDDERCVIEVASLPMLARGFDGLEDPAVEPDGMTTRAERNRTQIHGCCVGCPHRCRECSPPEPRSASGLARTASAAFPQQAIGISPMALGSPQSSLAA